MRGEDILSMYQVRTKSYLQFYSRLQLCLTFISFLEHEL